MIKKPRFTDGKRLSIFLGKSKPGVAASSQDQIAEQRKAVATATASATRYAGRKWVGPDHTKSPKGHLLSRDGTRRFRPPTWKMIKENGRFKKKEVQANFEERVKSSRSAHDRNWKFNRGRHTNLHVKVANSKKRLN